MTWTQSLDPFQNVWLSATVAAIPVIFIFLLLIYKTKGHVASPLTLLLCMAMAVILYQMPLKLAVFSALHGAMYGLFPIAWVILTAVFLFNITVKSGKFEVIKNFMASITPDRRLQAILIAFAFGAFLEGTSGFGAPVAISAAMLVGLGFDPLYAAGLCLIANTAPVAFGSVGTPIIAAATVTDIPAMAISQMVGRTLPFLSVLVPFYLVFIMVGWRKTLEVLPPIVIAGFSFALFQWLTSNYLGPMLPDVIAGLAAILSLMLLLKKWQPKSIWKFENEPAQTIANKLKYTRRAVLIAWSPYMVMTLLIILWGLQPVKDFLNTLGHLKIEMSMLNGAILKTDGTALAVKPFEFNYLSAPGTALLIASFLSLPIVGLSFREGLLVFWKSCKQLIFPSITIGSVVALAYVANNSGMLLSMAMALAATGVAFPFFSPILGWLGVFLTGSDTTSNALFGKLQASSAEQIGIDPVLTVAANASGGVTGKMISPQSIAIGAAAVGLVGRESSLFRFTIKHSFIMLLIVAILTMLQAYVFPWMIPAY